MELVWDRFRNNKRDGLIGEARRRRFFVEFVFFSPLIVVRVPLVCTEVMDFFCFTPLSCKSATKAAYGLFVALFVVVQVVVWRVFC